MLIVAIATPDVIGLVMISSLEVDVLGLAFLLLLLRKSNMEPAAAIPKKALAPQAMTSAVKDVRYMGICDTTSSNICGDNGEMFGTGESGGGNRGDGGERGGMTGGCICGDGGGGSIGGSAGGCGGKSGGRGGASEHTTFIPSFQDCVEGSYHRQEVADGRSPEPSPAR